MPIFFVQYEARPGPDSKDFGECGGAFINCWVKSDLESVAMQVALKDIKENKWEILSVEEKFREVTEKDYSEDQSGFEYYQQATIDGECYVYHRWPREPQDEDAVH